MNIMAIIQARMGSSRLPGKVLKELLGKPMLVHIVERVKQSNVDDVIVATSVDEENDVIRKVCKENNILCFSGNENNVLERFYYTAKEHKADIIIRITADCPLIDPDVINKLIEKYSAKHYSLMGVAAGAGVSNPNFQGGKYPQGLDAEIFPFKVLEKAFNEAVYQRDKEHVTPFIWTHPNRFNIGVLTSKIDYSGLRWVVDNQEDFDFIEKIYNALYPKNHKFRMEDVLKFLERNKEIQKINSKFIGKEGHEQFWKDN